MSFRVTAVSAAAVDSSGCGSVAVDSQCGHYDYAIPTIVAHGQNYYRYYC